MKTISKHIWFPVLLFLTLTGAKAQMGTDQNWDTQNPVFIDDFNTTGRYWNDFNSLPDCKWWAFALDYSAGVTLDENTLQVFRESNCHFNETDGSLEINSSHAGHELHCGDYLTPIHYGYECDHDISNRLFWSGHVETDNSLFSFGYYEIRCKLPTHMAAFPAFWLFGNGPSSYEEIDIFEYSWTKILPNYSDGGRLFTTGFWINRSEAIFPGEADSCVVMGHRLESNVASLDDWHVFGCDWSPNYIRWFLDGKLIHSYSVANRIPKSPKRIKVSYAIDTLALTNNWTGTGKMTVDYVKVFRLKQDCNTTANVRTYNELLRFQYGVKRFIYFTPYNQLIFPTNTGMTFRSVNGFRLTGAIRIPIGCSVSFIAQDCYENQ